MSLNQPRCRWLIGILLFVSLAVNVFLAGWVFGDGGFTRAKPARGLFFEMFDEKAKQLAEPQRKAVQAILDEYQPQLKKRMKRVMKSRELVDSMLRAKDYTRDEAEVAFDTLQEHSFEAQELAQEMMLDIADALPPADRATFLERPQDMRGRGAEFRTKKPVAKSPVKPLAKQQSEAPAHAPDGDVGVQSEHPPESMKTAH